MTAQVTGRVQGVGFRWWIRSRADELHLTGWATNDADERQVTVVAEGDPDDLDELEGQLWNGPSAAHVERVDAERGPASGEYVRFEIGRR
jgi:acylphosphatase